MKHDAGKKFESAQWMQRKQQIAERHKKRQEEAHKRALERKKESRQPTQ